MKITVDTTNVSREEVKVLVNYLENNSWEFEQEEEGEGEKPKYMLKEDSIHVIGSHGVNINEKIQQKELFEYNVVHRKSLIEDIYMWIPESNDNDRVLMKEDLRLLEGVTDDYIFSSISTNEYIYEGCDDFNETCENLLELNESLK